MGLIGIELSAPSIPLADLQLQTGGCCHHSYLKIFSVLGVTKALEHSSPRRVCLNNNIAWLLKLPGQGVSGDYIFKMNICVQEIFYNFIPSQCQALETTLKGHRACSQETQSWDFPGGPVAKTSCSQVLSLVRELDPTYYN